MRQLESTVEAVLEEVAKGPREEKGPAKVGHTEQYARGIIRRKKS
jgi:hypothetical protein